MAKEILKQIKNEVDTHPYNATKDLFKNILLKTERDELLTIFMEECAEATVEASKIIRFASPTAYQVPQLETEVGDLLCMIQLLEEYNLVSSTEIRERAKHKREKLKKWSNLNV